MTQPLPKPIRVMVPYVRLHPETKRAVASMDAGFYETSAPGSYWRVLADWWLWAESFIVLEQDKVPERGLLQRLWVCPEPWCAVRTPMRGTGNAADYPTLSCTKFGEPLMAAYPELMMDVGELDLGLGAKEWSRLDLAIAGLLSNVATVHWHDGVVKHLHQEAEVAAVA
jgi:hypothetical protein